MRSSEQSSASSTEVANSLVKGMLPLLCSVALATIGCGASPVEPAPARAAQQQLATAAALQPGGLDVESANANVTPAKLTERGWTCRVPPVPNRIVCSPPNQGFPTLGTPPPADRPASFTFFIFDSTDRFVGTELLLRTDLYKGQLCESTGEPYDFVPVIGYYECIHTVGR